MVHQETALLPCSGCLVLIGTLDLMKEHLIKGNVLYAGETGADYALKIKLD
jgi:hypothetical protein